MGKTFTLSPPLLRPRLPPLIERLARTERLERIERERDVPDAVPVREEPGAARGSGPVLLGVLTGGGAQLSGIEELAEAVFDMPVRIGTPDMLGREEPFGPQFATGVGLVRYAQEQSQGISGNGNGSWLKKVGHFAKQLVS